VIGGVTSGPAQIFGIDGDNVTFFSPLSGNFLVAGPGNVTLNGGGATGNNAFFAGPSTNSADSIVAGSGNNTLVAGPGSNTLVGGAGANVFAVDKAAGGGGADSIVGWNSNDLVVLSGYGAPTAPGGLPSGATTAILGGSEVLTLADGTKITFVGFSNIPNSHISSS
jgi:Ca2+-binding RTX toxin-like protein